MKEKRSPGGANYHNQDIIRINIICKYFKRWKKLNEIQLTKNKIAVNNQKMKTHPLSPGEQSYINASLWLAACSVHRGQFLKVKAQQHYITTEMIHYHLLKF